jgi:hypothetical protein
VNGSSLSNKLLCEVTMQINFFVVISTCSYNGISLLVIAVDQNSNKCLSDGYQLCKQLDIVI